jgi:FKBP-type peptidyl-prolyl cis-trans isomerase SlpA
MTTRASTIHLGARVRLHLAIRLQDGTEALSTFGEEPLALTIGDGTLAPGLEALLEGTASGEEKRLVADGRTLFGERIDEKIHWLPRGDFPAALAPEPGQVVAFETPGGEETAGLVLAVEGDRVQVDFNHPLAGRLLQIELQILDVAAPGSDPETP